MQPIAKEKISLNQIASSFLRYLISLIFRAVKIGYNDVTCIKGLEQDLF
jgi:hypothetical protein